MGMVLWYAVAVGTETQAGDQENVQRSHCAMLLTMICMRMSFGYAAAGSSVCFILKPPAHDLLLLNGTADWSLSFALVLFLAQGLAGLSGRVCDECFAWDRGGCFARGLLMVFTKVYGLGLTALVRVVRELLILVHCRMLCCLCYGENCPRCCGCVEFVRGMVGEPEIPAHGRDVACAMVMVCRDGGSDA
ncbi:hypothetical protein Nepgr_014802 [Nepenthes gracilis]|uniref:Uncharacterized protein n=1 Tax=Nepenthes gracilis TaxID=150966 RepID=A0AAD3XQP8_NEPGR|nr:hypothetical protein Nepgr_014802 [Nepenthes gracilis]